MQSASLDVLGVVRSSAPPRPVTARLAEDRASVTAAAPSAEMAALFERTAALVHRAACRITGRREDADDVLQTVFLHLLRTPPLEWPAHPVRYVHRAAVNGALDVLRRRRRRSEAPVPEQLTVTRDEESAALRRVDGDRLVGRLREALVVLTPLEAEMFVLRYVEELDNVEIAGILERTPNHVGVTLHSARAKLRAVLADDQAPADRAASVVSVPGHDVEPASEPGTALGDPR